MINDDEMIKAAVEAHLAVSNLVDMQHEIFDTLIEPAIIEYIEAQVANDDAEMAQNERLLEKGLMEPIGSNQW